MHGWALWLWYVATSFSFSHTTLSLSPFPRSDSLSFNPTVAVFQNHLCLGKKKEKKIYAALPDVNGKSRRAG